VKTISQLKEFQGVIYVPGTDRIYVANGDDGSVHIFDGIAYAHLKTLDFGDDADNLRYDSGRKRIYVGYGSRALGASRRESQGNRKCRR
jgi:DNA-binding beta-propeller fold protein YncE